MFRLVLLGPPGAGKGTQAALLSEFLGVEKISTGDLLRKSIIAGDKLGKLAEQYMNQGKLVPDHIIVDVVANYLQKDSCRSGYLLDGFPRTINQALSLADMGVELTHVFALTVSDDLIVKRMSGRRVHINSGRVYHVDNNPPKQDGVDDITGEKLVQRPDDNESTVRDRLAVYQQQTKPLLAHYKKDSCSFFAIDGSGSIDSVQLALKVSLEAG